MADYLSFTKAILFELLYYYKYCFKDLCLDMNKVTDLVSKNKEEIAIFGISALIVQLYLRTRTKPAKSAPEE